MNLLSPDAFTSADSKPMVLDVRLADAYARQHLPAAENNCVYEVAFVTRVPESWAKDQALLLYGEDGESQEAQMAGEKLERLGFTQVHLLEGGLAGWVAAGLPVEGSGEAVPSLPALQHEVALDLEQSEIQWTGRNLLNRHVGTLKFSKGTLIFEDGVLSGGDFEIDWDSLACIDLAGTPLHDVLMHHLKDHDFFDVAAYPAPTIRITRSEMIPGASPGENDLRIGAEMTLKGLTNAFSFEAATGRDAEGHYALQASFALDRSYWGVKYASGKFFKNLGIHRVNDMLEFGLKLVSA